MYSLIKIRLHDVSEVPAMLCDTYLAVQFVKFMEKICGEVPQKLFKRIISANHVLYQALKGRSTSREAELDLSGLCMLIVKLIRG